MTYALVVTLCFLAWDGTPTDDCRHLWKMEKSEAECRADQIALPPIIGDRDGREFVDSDCYPVPKRGAKI